MQQPASAQRVPLVCHPKLRELQRPEREPAASVCWIFRFDWGCSRSQPASRRPAASGGSVTEVASARTRAGAAPSLEPQRPRHRLLPLELLHRSASSAGASAGSISRSISSSISSRVEQCFCGKIGAAAIPLRLQRAGASPNAAAAAARLRLVLHVFTG